MQSQVLNFRITQNSTTRPEPRVLGEMDIETERWIQSRCSLLAIKSDPPLLPAKFNWDTLGMVSPVAVQARCQSCYVFATTNAMESQYMIGQMGKRWIKRQKTKSMASASGKGKEAVRFSVQATLNCMPYGCSGGGLPDPLSFMRDVGVTLQKYDPYIGDVSGVRGSQQQRLKVTILTGATMQRDIPDCGQSHGLLLPPGP